MLVTATHDHKRGEDLRARLAVLATIPERWATIVRRWRDRNAARKPTIDGVKGPDATDEYILYQMLVGAWPRQLQADDEAGRAQLGPQLAACQEKAVREATRHPGWTDPHPPTQATCPRFPTHTGQDRRSE